MISVLFSVLALIGGLTLGRLSVGALESPGVGSLDHSAAVKDVGGAQGLRAGHADQIAMGEDDFDRTIDWPSEPTFREVADLKPTQDVLLKPFEDKVRRRMERFRGVRSLDSALALSRSVWILQALRSGRYVEVGEPRRVSAKLYPALKGQDYMLDVTGGVMRIFVLGDNEREQIAAIKASAADHRLTRQDRIDGWGVDPGFAEEHLRKVSLLING